MANYVKENDTAAIWNTDASLDNYGGVQTPVMTLDFSKAVIFRMNVVSCHTQYIVKLAVEGESEYYYVLSDDGKTGMVSINVVDAMLCDKYRAKNTQPDPGYRDGWKFKDMKKDCSFHILAKGPDGAQQTAELVLKDISIFNNQTAVESVEITSDSIQDGKLTALKNSENVKLNATINPTDVSDKDILWSSQNPDIAKVDENGNVSFVGVGKTYITAMSKIDQSKSKSISVNVLSGYEDVGKLKGKLNNLSFDGSDKDAEIFADLFNTSWYKDADMMQKLSIGQYEALNCRIVGNKAYIHNYFNNENQAFVNEANNHADGDEAYIEMALKGAENATIYCNINGKLYKTDYDGLFKLQYLTKENGKWEKIRTYTEQIIIENTDGTIKKAEFTINSSVKIAEYTAKDFVNNNLWTIPDRSKQTENPAVHSLSPAKVELDGDMVKIKQNKYPESKYCYGGIASNVLTASSDQTLEIILDVDSLNQMNDYVKTMWEIRIIYYGNDKITPVSSTPLKTMSGNTAGCQTFKFKPAYDNFALYLMVNGSDIGAQFADAEMKIKRLNIYSLN